MGGLEDSESLFTHVKTKKVIAENFSARHSPSFQQALAQGGLGNFYRLPGTENPADGSTKVRKRYGPSTVRIAIGATQPGFSEAPQGCVFEARKGLRVVRKLRPCVRPPIARCLVSLCAFFVFWALSAALFARLFFGCPFVPSRAVVMAEWAGLGPRG